MTPPDVPALLAEVERLREELRLSAGEREDLDTGAGVLLGENVELEARLREAQAAAANLAALRQELEALADEWERNAEQYTVGAVRREALEVVDRLRAVLAEHATPSDLPTTQTDGGEGETRQGPLRSNLPAVATPSDPPQDDDEAWNRADVHGCIVEDEDTGRCLMCRDCASPAPASADTEGVRLTEEERQELRFALAHYVREYDEGSRVYEVVERIKVDAYKAGLVEARSKGVRLTEEEKSYGRSDPGLQWRGRWYSEASVERILAARLRAATEGKGEA